MKKLLYCLIFVFVVSIFNISKVEALSCFYESQGKDDDGKKVKMVLYDINGGIFVSPLQEFYVNGEQQSEEDYWSSESYFKNHFKNYSTNKKLTSTDPCPNYMYYDQVIGQNMIYFSDSSSINKGYDLKFKLNDPYQESDENALLEEIFCTYKNPNSTVEDITFKINHNGTSGTYQIWLGYDKISSGKFTNDSVNSDINKYEFSESSLLSTLYRYYSIGDHFSVRKFWDSETGKYVCPKNILVGAKTSCSSGPTTICNYDIELGYDERLMQNYTDTDTVKEFFQMVSDSADLFLYERQEYSSLVKFEYGTVNQGQICEYGREETGREPKLALKEYKYSNRENYYVALLYNKTVGNINTETIASGLIDNSCDNLPIIYTDCLNTTSNNCTVKTENFSNKDNKGNELVEPLYTLSDLNDEDITDVIEGMANYSGFRYKRLICELSDRMNFLDYNKNLIKRKLTVYDNMLEYKSQYYIYDLPCDEWELTQPFECDETCKSKIDFLIQNKIEDIVLYCKTVYASFSGNKSDSTGYARVEECNSFHAFYNQMIEAGIVEDYAVGCDIISSEFQQLLQWVLNVIKIAAPILVIILGSLDFIKVLFSSDPDKETKEAFKKFKNRLIAAVLLFLIPVILQFCMNIILDGQQGYDKENPFCDLR